MFCLKIPICLKSKNSRKHFSNLDAAPGSAGQPAQDQRCLVTLLNGFCVEETVENHESSIISSSSVPYALWGAFFVQPSNCMWLPIVIL